MWEGFSFCPNSSRGLLGSLALPIQALKKSNVIFLHEFLFRSGVSCFILFAFEFKRWAYLLFPQDRLFLFLISRQSPPVRCDIFIDFKRDLFPTARYFIAIKSVHLHFHQKRWSMNFSAYNTIYIIINKNT